MTQIGRVYHLRTRQTHFVAEDRPAGGNLSLAVMETLEPRLLLSALPADPVVNGTVDFPGHGSLTWDRIDWNWNAGLSSQNVAVDNDVLSLHVDGHSGVGAQVESENHSYGYYGASIKASAATAAPQGVCQAFFYYYSDTQEIDAEILSAKPGYVYYTVQGGDAFRVAVSDQDGQYHEYGFDWEKGWVKFFVDGQLAVGDRVIPGGTQGEDVVLRSDVQAVTTRHIPRHAGQMILNDWSGNEWAGSQPDAQTTMLVQDVTWPGRPSADITLPSTVPLNSQGRASYIDGQGHTVNVHLAHGGTGTLYFAYGGPCDLDRVVLSGTTPRSSLKISTGSANYGATVREIDTGGFAIGSIVAKTIDLSGAIHIGTGANSAAAVRIDLGHVSDAAIDSAMPIHSLSVRQWLDTDGVADLIQAPWIGSITSRRGDFEADVKLTSPAAPGGVSLGRLSVATWLKDATIQSAAGIGAVTAGGISGSNIYAGTLSSVVGLPDALDSFAPASIGKITVKGTVMDADGFSTIASNFAAISLGRIFLRHARLDNQGKPWGVLGNTPTSLVLAQSGRRYAYPTLPTSDSNDFAVKIVRP